MFFYVSDEKLCLKYMKLPLFPPQEPWAHKTKMFLLSSYYVVIIILIMMIQGQGQGPGAKARTQKRRGPGPGTGRCQVLGTKYLVPSAWYQVLGSRYLYLEIFGTKYLVPGTKYLVPSTWY